MKAQSISAYTCLSVTQYVTLSFHQVVVASKVQLEVEACWIKLKLGELQVYAALHLQVRV